MKNERKTFRSSCALGTVALFVLFLIASAPHRVHHLLENLPPPAKPDASGVDTPRNHTHAPDSHAAHSHDTESFQGAPSETDSDGSAPTAHADRSQRDHNHDGSSSATDCFVQTVAQQSHLAPAPIAPFAFRAVVVSSTTCAPNLSFSDFHPFPGSQRAPPIL